MQQIVLLAPWNSYADTVDHYCYVRCLDVGNLYEVVRVTHDKHGQQAEFVHQVIFMTEYSEPALAEILRGFGFEKLDAFVCEAKGTGTDPAGFTVRQDGSIDRAASPSWQIDYMLLASLMAEHFDGRMMTIQAADDMARVVVEGSPIAPNPFCIRRTFGGQLVTIPLTEKEVDVVCAAKGKQVQMAYLKDEISDLEKNDLCFDGLGQSALLNDEGLLTDVQRRWHHYNGNGGDHTENLREAIKVTIHAHFPQ